MNPGQTRDARLERYNWPYVPFNIAHKRNQKELEAILDRLVVPEAIPEYYCRATRLGRHVFFNTKVKPKKMNSPSSAAKRSTKCE